MAPHTMSQPMSLLIPSQSLDQCLMQVNSEFQAFKHIDIRSRGEMARAMKSLEATLALQPTLILTNSLPCSLDVIVWQARGPAGMPVKELLLPSISLCICSCHRLTPSTSQ